MKKALWTVLIGCFTVVFGSVATQGQDEEILVMPTELCILANANGYTQISNFYRIRPGFTNPPFVYGYKDSDPGIGSVAFWCQKKTDTTNTEVDYFLLLAVRRGGPWLSKVAEIKWYLPCGLSVLRDSTIPLSSFVYLDDRGYTDEKSEPGPEGVYTEGNAIRGAYWGEEVIFYEYQGRWLVNWTWDE